MRKPLIAGNWKMYKTKQEAVAFAKEFSNLINVDDINIAICAPFTSLETIKCAFEKTNVKIGAQNVHFEKEGAFTGEISIDMLNEIGVEYCLIGHSERREYFNETDESINKKIIALFDKSDIIPILCVGENLSQREAGDEETVVRNQLKKDLQNVEEKYLEKLIIAYEPIWAIGTGKTATSQEAGKMCELVRKTIAEIYNGDASEKVHILYGGSVKGENIKDLMKMPSIDGALVGGASLSPSGLRDIVEFKK